MVLEKKDHVGGMGASIKIKNYIADYGPHTFHLKKSIVSEVFEELAGHDCNKVHRNAKLWLHGKYMPFPLQPIDVVSNLNPFLVANIGFDYLWENSFGKLNKPSDWEPATFEEWGIQNFGKTLYHLAFGNYSEKMWGLPGSELSAKLAKQKLSSINLKEMVMAMLGLLNQNKADAMGLSTKNLYDAYPRKGIGTFFEAVADKVEENGGQVLMNARPTKIHHENNKITSLVYEQDGRSETIECEAVLSSIPLPLFLPLLDEKQFQTPQVAAGRLKYRSLRVVHLVLNQERFSNAHWVYMLDDRLYGNRISEQKNLSVDSCPEGQTVVCIDYTCDFDDYIWNTSESFMITRAMEDLKTMGLHPRVILDAFVLNAPHVYPIYSLGFEKDMASIIDGLSHLKNLFSFGRHGLLLNNDMHDSMEMGFMVAQMHMDKKDSSDWYAVSNRYVEERLEGYVRDPIKFDPKGKAIDDRQ